MKSARLHKGRLYQPSEGAASQLGRIFPAVQNPTMFPSRIVKYTTFVLWEKGLEVVRNRAGCAEGFGDPRTGVSARIKGSRFHQCLGSRG
jgi:hypothetical protein